MKKCPKNEPVHDKINILKRIPMKPYGSATVDGVKLEEQLRSTFESAVHEPRGGLSEELDVLVNSEDRSSPWTLSKGKDC